MQDCPAHGGTLRLRFCKALRRFHLERRFQHSRRFNRARGIGLPDERYLRLSVSFTLSPHSVEEVAQPSPRLAPRFYCQLPARRAALTAHTTGLVLAAHQ